MVCVEPACYSSVRPQQVSIPATRHVVCYSMLHANLRSILCISSDGVAKAPLLMFTLRGGCPFPDCERDVGYDRGACKQDLLNLMGGRLKEPLHVASL
jgi:hypothetical protein